MYDFKKISKASLSSSCQSMALASLTVLRFAECLKNVLSSYVPEKGGQTKPSAPKTLDYSVIKINLIREPHSSSLNTTTYLCEMNRQMLPLGKHSPTLLT